MKFALLIFYAAGTLAAPVLDDRYPKAEIKELDCSNSRFREGATVQYEYSGESINNVEGSTTQSTGLQLTSKVFITQLENCKFHMRLSQSKLSTKGMNEDAFKEGAESETLRNTLETNDLLFSMNGNTIVQLQPRESETTEALNIKRGILSALQLDETKSDETDVNGACQYRITKNEGSIIKTKSLSDCSQRALNEIGIQAASFKTGSDLKPLNSMSTCTYTMDGNTVRSVNCVEKHLFRPFSAGYKTTAGAMTVVNQKMEFSALIGINEKYETKSYNMVKSLAFEHSVESQQTETLTGQVELVIRRLIDQSNLSAKKTSAQEFSTLVALFRKMSRTKMTAIWDKYFDCAKSKVCEGSNLNMKDLYRQYLLDAIAYCGTPSCIAVVKDVTISGEVAGERANMFLQSIALVAKTTNSMIRDILEIAERKPSRQVYLTLGTLLSRHCAKSPAECDVQSGNAVISAFNFLERTLGECENQEDHERVEQILITLKAIGNAKRPVNARDAIIRCATKSIHSNITVSAFDALRAMPCDANTVNQLIRVVGDENLAADKRIYAFQAAIKCPTKDSLERLVQLFNMEKNNQLSSFMWSYLTNTLESSNPDNKEAKTLLEAIVKETPLKKVDLPMYQYSKNFEKSLYIDSINTGATAQGNVVFHPDGFLPKTAMFEMTAKVMGVPVDLVETVVGIDGVETILENAFGPDGVVPKDFNFRMFNFTWSSEKLREMVQTRVRRELKPKLNDDNVMVNDIHEAINKQPAKPSGFMSLKVMGQEVRIMSYDDIYALIDQIDNMNVIQLLLNWAKGGSKTFSKSLMFLEMTHSVPTGLGLPLKLKLTGSTVGTMELSGRFDIRSLFWGPAGMNIKGFVKPTAVVDISGKMGIESNLVSTGLKVSNNMIVSNMLKGSINYKEGEILQINLDTPEEPVQLFHASSTPYMYVNEQSTMIEGVQRVIKGDKCFGSKIIGYGLCTTMRLPVAFREYEAPYFPLSGPAHVGLSLTRGDEKLTTFQFKTTMKKIPYGVEGEIEFSTPGAFYERKVNGKMLYTDVDNNKVFAVSSEALGSVRFSFNGLSKATSVEAKTNVFKKDLITRFEYFNVQNDNKFEFGVKGLAQIGDIYKFTHESKIVLLQSESSFEMTTGYAPNKVINAALRYTNVDQKLRATIDMNQFRQSFEVSGKLEKSAKSKGLTLSFIHVSTGKSVTLYSGIDSTDGGNELVMSANILGRPIKNILGLYTEGGKTTLRNFFLLQQDTATVELSYEDREGSKEIQMNADIFGRSGMVNALYTSGTEKILRVTADAAGKRLTSTIFVTNMDVEKSIRFSIDTSNGKVGELNAGFYNMKDLIIFKVGGEVMKKKTELFWKLRTSGGFQSTVGGVLNQYVYGVKSTFGNSDPRQKSLCSSIYYGTEEAENVAVKTCVKYNVYDSEQKMHKQMEYSIELPVIDKRVTMTQDFTYQPQRLETSARIMYNGDKLATSRLIFKYNTINDNAVEFDVESRGNTANAKLYSQGTKDSNDCTRGLLMRFNDNTVRCSVRCSEVKYENEVQSRISSSISLNGRILPVTTDIDVVTRDSEVIVSGSVNAGKYTLKQTVGVLYGNTKYGFGLSTEMLTDGRQSGRVFVDVVSTVSDKKWGFEHLFGFALGDKEYKYGWNADYETQFFGEKQTHVLRSYVRYSTNRRSGVSLYFTNSEKICSIEMDFEYIPSKTIRHTARFDKNQRQLNINIEFLPKMFAKFMARLDNQNGYELVTSSNLEWGKFRKELKTVTSYLNNANELKISVTVAGDLTVGMTINKAEPKSVTLMFSGLGNNAELTAAYQNMQVSLDVIVNEQSLVKLEANYDQVSKSVRMLARRGDKIVFDITSGYNKMLNAINVAVAGASKWGGILMTTKGDKTIVSFTLMGKGFGKITLDRATKTMSIDFKSSTSVLFKYQPKSKVVFITLKSGENTIAFIVKADWTKKIASATLEINKESFGSEIALRDSTLNFDLTATPFMTLRLIFTYSDSGINMNVQRIANGKTISEVSFNYGMTKEACEFLFNWNPETIREMTNMVQPVIESALVQSKALMESAIKNSDKIVSLSKNAKLAIIEFMRKLEKAFNEFDFVAARDEVSAATVNALRVMSKSTVEALNTLAASLDNAKARVPEIVQKLRSLIKDIKNINVQGQKQEVIAKAKDLIENGRKMVMKGQKLILNMRINENLREIMNVAQLIAANLTESSRPVVDKAIFLIKDFRIRGLRVEDIAYMVEVEGLKYMTERFNEMKTMTTTKFNELKEQVVKACDKATQYLMQLNVPYTDKTVKQLIEMIRQQIADIKEKIQIMDAEAFLNEMKTKLMNYNFQGKPVSQYVGDLKAQLVQLKSIVVSFVERYQVSIKDLPESTRKALKQIIRGTRDFVNDMEQYISTMTTYVDQVKEFVTPLVNHLKLVKSSVTKHFGPVVENIVAQIMTTLNQIEMPQMKPHNFNQVREFVLPLVRPLVPLYRNILDQIRALNIMGRNLGAGYDMQVEIMNARLSNMVSDARMNMNNQMNILNNMVEEMKRSSPEQIIDNSIDKAVGICNKLVAYINSMYEKRSELKEKTIASVMKAFNKMKTQYEQVSAKSLNNMTEKVISASSDGIVLTTGELSNLIKQIVAMDISAPTWKAWTDADVVGHFERFGVNDKLRKALKYAKDTQLKEAIAKTIKVISAFVDASVQQSSVKALELYNQVDKIMKYLKSIPKKDYDTWFNEMSEFVFSNQAAIEKTLKKIFEVSRRQAMKAYVILERLAKEDSRRLYKEYADVAKEWYNVVADKSQLVYQDVKQPSIDVYNHYKSTIMDFVEAKYAAFKEIVIAEYEKTYADAEARIGELRINLEENVKKMIKYIKVKVTEIRMKTEQVYGELMEKYGDLTWEEVAAKLAGLTKAQLQVVKEKVTIQYKKILKQATKIQTQITVKVQDVYNKAVVEYKRIVQIVLAKFEELKSIAESKYNDIKPQVMALYNKYRTMIESRAQDLISKVTTLFNDAKAKATEIYNLNKDKTLRQIYNEIKEIIMENYMKQKEYLTALTQKNSEKANQLLNEAKAKVMVLYSKVGLNMKTIVIPELLMEMESIFNQTLRNSVIMSKEIVNAYTPHAIVARDLAKQYYDVLERQIPVLLSQGKMILNLNKERAQKLLEKTIAQVTLKVKELVETLKKNEKYTKYVATLEEKLTQLKGVVTKKYEELSTNPSLLKIKAEIEAKIAELKIIIKEKMNEIMANPNVVLAKERIEAAIQVVRQQVDEYQVKLDVYVKQATATLKQIQTSAKYTTAQLEIYGKPFRPQGMSVDAVPKLLNNKFQDFVASPEETFWNAVAACNDVIISSYEYVKAIKSEEGMEEFLMTIDQFKSIGKDMYFKTTDEWTKATINKISTEIMAVYDKLIKQYNSFVASGKDLPSMIYALYEKNLVLFVKELDGYMDLVKNQIVKIQTYLSESAIKDIVTNQVWSELYTEVKNHELVGLTKEFSRMALAQVAGLREKYTPVISQKYAQLKAILEDFLQRTKDQSIALYKDLDGKITLLMKKGEKIFDETTVADIVAFVAKQYEQAIAKFNELSAQVMNKAEDLYAQYKVKALELYEQYKSMAMPYYVKAIDMYKRYYEEVSIKAQELTDKLIALRKDLETRLGDVISKTQKMFIDYKTMAIVELKKTQATLIKKWEESVIVAKFNTIKKMTVRQTVEILKKLPSDIYQEIVQMSNKIVAELKTIYYKLASIVEMQLGKLMKIVRPYLVNVKDVYGWIENEITETVTFIAEYYGFAERYNRIERYILAEIETLIASIKSTAPNVPELLKKYADLVKGKATRTANEYVRQYKRLVNDYARQARDVAKQTGDKTLRGIHASLVMLDNYEIPKIALPDHLIIKTTVMEFVDKIKANIIISNKDGEISIKILHNGLKSTIMQYAKLMQEKAMNVMKTLEVYYNDALELAKAELIGLKERAGILGDKIQEIIVRNTEEIRRDFNISFKVTKKIANKIYEILKPFVEKTYRTVKAKVDMIVRLASRQINNLDNVYRQIIATSKVVYSKLDAFMRDVSNAKSSQELYEILNMYADKYYKRLSKEVNALIKQYKPVVVEQFRKMKEISMTYVEQLKELSKQINKENLMKYYGQLKRQSAVVTKKAVKMLRRLSEAVTKASSNYAEVIQRVYNELKAGIPMEEVFRPLTRQIVAIYAKVKAFVMKQDIRGKICANNLELCKLVDEAIAAHQMLAAKYFKKVESIMSLAKAKVDRTVRKMNKDIKDKNVLVQYTATAMIKGDYILTFDNKLYNFVDFVKTKNKGASPCRYLLARDFQDKKFTIVKSDNAISIETPDMAIKIRDDGRVKATIGKEDVRMLPVDAKNSQCARMDNLVLCHFRDQRLKVTVDLKNGFTIISLSGWYKGKTQGLLGTYNNEGHDDWKLPNSQITKNVNEFVNKYELSGKNKCQMDLKTDHTTACVKPMSKKCRNFFMSSSSPFSNYFSVADPRPFMELCKQESKCGKQSPSVGACEVVASYVTMLRTKGVWVSHPNECMSDRGRDINEEWAQSPAKDKIDIVVMVSQKANMQKMKKRVAITMYQLHQTLKKANIKARYALIGFGGDGVHEAAHTMPLRPGQTVFGYVLDLNKIIKTMPYEGKSEDTNDGYHAVLMASRLKFRAGAEKIFLMFNSAPHSSHESGPSFDETKFILENEANAPLIVFDTVTFPNFGAKSGRVLGQTERKLYTTKNLKGISDRNLNLPASEFKKLILLSKGALFSNTALKKPRQASISLNDSILNWIQKDIQVCKRCVLRNSWTGQSRPICVPDPTAQC
jgi:hypothetical protein